MKVVFRVVLGLMGFALFAALAAASLVGYYQYRYADRIYPGVKLGGIDLSGMRPEQAFQAAVAQSYYYKTPALKLKIGDSVFEYRPADFGAGLDPAATIANALRVGREGDLQARLEQQYNAWRHGVDISPVATLDDEAAKRVLDTLARRTEQPPVNAAIEIEAGAAREIPSQQGTKLNTQQAMTVLLAAIHDNKPVEASLPLDPIQPKLESAKNVSELANRMVGSDLVIMVPQWNAEDKAAPAKEAFRIRAADMPQFVTLDQAVKNGKPEINVTLRRDRIKQMIETLAPAVAQAPVNAKFSFDDNSGQLVPVAPAKTGRALDVEKSLDAIEAAATSANREAILVVSTTQPLVGDNATAQDLHITRLVAQATTYFRGSTQARLANVKVAAARFHGVIVEPQATFSFNDIVGNISKEDGFEEGLVIVGTKTVKGVGGGVCQVSTTAYQAALKAGFPIKERYNHGYRVGYYEKGIGPGFDSTVFSPWADLKFVNDTDAYLLIETYFDASLATLTFKFYSTPDGREVSFTPSVIDGITPHGPDIYERDTSNEVAPGQIKQLDHAVDGATISFERTVTRGGQVIISEKVISKYQPWQARFKYGEGFTPPEGAIIVDPNAPTPTP